MRTAVVDYTTRPIGAPNTIGDTVLFHIFSSTYSGIHVIEHRVYVEKNGSVVSPFHDVPLFADQACGTLNLVVTAPRWTNAKMEISKDDYFNPVKQDAKKGRLQFVRNCFPHHGYIWNYGALPQVSRLALANRVRSR